MSSQLADLHITAQERLRALLAQIVTSLWLGLGSYDEDDVEPWLLQVVPVVLGAQHQSVALTEAFLSLALGRPPVGVSVDEVVAKVRGTVTPGQVYRRPFVTVWTGLQEQTGWDDAVAQGLDRATSAAVTDVQLAMRQTLVDVGERDDLILGYRRVPDSGACEFCRLVSGQRYHTSELMPVHNHCGCGVDVITEASRGDFAGKRHLDRPHGVAVHEHGELGPVLTAPEHQFTSAADF